MTSNVLEDWKAVKESYITYYDELMKNDDRATLRLLRPNFNQSDSTDTFLFRVKKVFRVCGMADYCRLVSTARPITVEKTFTNADFALPSFERGLYLDYLLQSLKIAYRCYKKYAVTQIKEFEDLYNDLVNVYQNHENYKDRLILSDDVKINCQKSSYTIHVSTSKTQKSYSVYEADMPFLMFYYQKTNGLIFPWQRHAQTTGGSKFSFSKIAQPFPLDELGEKGRIGEVTDAISEKLHPIIALLDFYYRELDLGINLSVELSRYDLECMKQNVTIEQNEIRRQNWLNIKKLKYDDETNNSFITRLAKVSYPCYRISFVRNFLDWYFSEDRTEIGKELRRMPLTDLMASPGNFIACIQDEVGFPKLYDIITMDSLDYLMQKAQKLSVLTCIEIASGKENLSEEVISDYIERESFWEKYMEVLCIAICEEIAVFYRGESNENSKENIVGELKKTPAILLPKKDDHLIRLTKTLMYRREPSSENAKAYSEFQQLVWAARMDEQSNA